MNTIDPYNEEVWEDVEKNWIIIVHDFPGLTSKSNNKFTHDEVVKLCDKLNKESDVYTTYTYEKV